MLSVLLQSMAGRRRYLFTPNSRIFNSERDGFRIYLIGFYYGTIDQVKISVQPFLDIDGAEADFREVTFLEATEIDAAFYYRDANYIIGIETVWEKPEAELSNLTWLLPRFQYLKSVTAGSYINFPYLCTDRYMSAYYGKNANRLSCIKKSCDPHHLFKFPQNIC